MDIMIEKIIFMATTSLIVKFFFWNEK